MLDLNFTDNDVHLSYLPLPHIFERGIVHMFLAIGATICFYQGDMQKLKEDLLLV